MRRFILTLLVIGMILGVGSAFAADSWDQRRETLVTERATGAAAIASSIAPASNEAFMVYGFYLKLSAAPTTSENFTVGIDSGGGAAYDANIYTKDFTIGSVTDLVKMFDEPIVLTAGDEIDFAWANTDTRTYGLTMIWRRIR